MRKEHLESEGFSDCKSTKETVFMGLKTNVNSSFPSDKQPSNFAWPGQTSHFCFLVGKQLTCLSPSLLGKLLDWHENLIVLDF